MNNERFPEQSDGYKLMEWIDGAADCRHGRPFAQNRSEHYEKGYAQTYEMEQVQAWVSENGRIRKG